MNDMVLRDDLMGIGLQSEEDFFEFCCCRCAGEQVRCLVFLWVLDAGGAGIALGVELVGFFVDGGGGGGVGEEVVVGLDVGADLAPHGLECADLLVLLVDVEGAHVEPPQGETSKQQCAL